jgi:flagellar biosynthesis GTPase FlhF
MSTNGSTGTARVYRGRSTAELIPTIQAELGPDAIVIARRSGLEGGLGGFFQRPFVEIEAQPAPAGIDLYDGSDATPPSLGAATSSSTASDDAETFARLTGSAEIAAPGEPLPAARNGASPSHDLTRGAMPATPPGSPPQEEMLVATATATGSAPARGQSFDSEFASLLALATKQPGEPAPAAHAIAETSELGSYSPYRAVPTPPREAVHRDELHVDELQLVELHVDGPAAIAPATGQGEPTTPEPPRSKVAVAVAGELTELGFDEAFAAELISQAATHVLPFAGRIGLRRAVRIALERRIPGAAPLPAGGAALALVGPGGSGKTKCAAALAAGYRHGGPLPVGCASIYLDRDSLKMVFSPRVTTPTQARSQRALKALATARTEGLVLLDTPTLSPAQTAELKELGRVLAEIGPDRTIAMLPAPLGARSASQLLAALAPLEPGAIAITHADETDQLGVAVQAACVAGLAPEYVLTGARGARSIERIDAAGLAERLLP